MTAAAQTSDIDAVRLCPGCGYDLRATVSDRCPECGLLLKHTGGGASSIPWVHRQSIGKRRAYARTVRLAMFHPSRLAAEIAQPVRFEDARAFSRGTALRAWWPIALLTLWIYAASLRLPVVPDVYPGDSALKWHGSVPLIKGSVPVYATLEPGDPLSLGFALEALCALGLLGVELLALLGVLRVATLFFHPADRTVVQQNRAVAIAHYGGAAFGWLPSIAPLLAVAVWHNVLSFRPMYGASLNPGLLCAELLGLAMLVSLVTWSWITWLILLRRTLHCSAGRTIGLALGLPVLWILIWLVALSLPAMLFLLCLIGFSW